MDEVCLLVEEKNVVEGMVELVAVDVEEDERRTEGIRRKVKDLSLNNKGEEEERRVSQGIRAACQLVRCTFE